MSELTECRNCGGDEFSIEGGPCPACKGTGFDPPWYRGEYVIIDPQGRRYIAHTEKQANYVRDTVGGSIHRCAT